MQQVIRESMDDPSLQPRDLTADLEAQLYLLERERSLEVLYATKRQHHFALQEQEAAARAVTHGNRAQRRGGGRSKGKKRRGGAVDSRTEFGTGASSRE